MVKRNPPATDLNACTAALARGPGASFRGTVYTSALVFVETRFGHEALPRILAELAPNERALLAGIDPDGWYDTGPVLSFHRALDRLYGEGDLTLCKEIGRFSAEWALSSFLRFALRFTSPHRVFERAGSLWGQYHDTGVWEIPPREPQRISGILRDFGVADRAFCLRFQGWLVGAIELTGGRDAHVYETRCRALGDPHCEFSGTWGKADR